MTAQERDQKLSQIVFQVGIRDVMIEAAEREKRDLLTQYRTLQQTPVDPAEEAPTDG